MFSPTLHHLLLFSSIALAQIPSEFASKFDTTSGISLVLSFGTHQVIDGEHIPLLETKQTPTFALGQSSPINVSAKYIVVGIDPDAPRGKTHPSPSSNKEAPMPYRPPAPPEGTGPHRYIWLLYQQPRVFQIKDVPVNRTNFNVTIWATANGLEPPVAGTYFEAEFADGRASNSSSSSLAVSSKHSATPTSSAAVKSSVSATTSATESGSSLPRASTSASRTNTVIGRNEDKVWWILLAVVGRILEWVLYYKTDGVASWA
ncbi:phosphatidylethanolamine-binding protein [Trichophaea hybrida]|nr:phosphatidylethanolamine-binding protein [Trichophaea hybrida]